MPRLALSLPGLLSDESHSVLRDPPPTLGRMVSEGDVCRLNSAWGPGSPIGLPADFRPPAGPLHVAAFGADPPSRSVQFALSLGTMTDAQVGILPRPLPPAQVAECIENLKRLDTRMLKLVEGWGAHHGLVWLDGSPEVGCHELGLVPVSYRTHLPVGDGEPMLRRYIDDSVNMLSELEFNRVRVEEGLPPVNVAWPWAPGFRPEVENLSLRYGPVHVESGSLALAGLSRLAGLKHGDWTTFERGTATAVGRLAPGPIPVLGVVDAFLTFDPQQHAGEREFLLRRLDEEVLAPWVALEPPGDVLICASAAEGGLALRWNGAAPRSNRVPFDERALEERLPTLMAHELLRDHLGS